MDDTDSDVDKVWEKCARRLMLNSKEKLDKFQAIVLKLLRNIFSMPNDPKFRVLRFSNLTVKTAVLDVPGGMELLAGIGFVCCSSDTGEKFLSGDLVKVESIEVALSWLDNTVKTCKSFCLSDQRQCAECIVQVRLPTGNSVNGGFLRSETLRDVRDFAACYFISERASSVKVSLPDVSVSVGEQCLSSSLEELGLYPRAVVLASVFSAEEREARLARRHMRENAVQQEKIKIVTSHKKSISDARREHDEERAKILAAFKEDHFS